MLKPLGDRVIIEVTEAAEETVGGIVLASNAKDKPVTGKVVAAGTGYVLNDGTVRDLTDPKTFRRPWPRPAQPP